MKKVYSSSSDVMHLFAQRTQDEARTSSNNVFFNNVNKIYSYGHHYLLCEFIDDNTVMINDTGYSVTTSKHISEITGATRQYRQFFKAETDLETVYNEVNHLKNKLARANKPELYINPIQRLWKTLNEFLVYSKTKKYKSHSQYKAIKAIVTALNGNSEEFKAKLLEASKKQAKAQKRKDAKKLKEKLTKFMSYESDYIYGLNEDFLRISEDGTKIETSQRISIKKENAIALYKMIDKGIDIAGKHIENYVVTSINGTLKIGCHNINIESVHSIGKQLLV